jgi:hypothetical protein
MLRKAAAPPRRAAEMTAARRAAGMRVEARRAPDPSD